MDTKARRHFRDVAACALDGSRTDPRHVDHDPALEHSAMNIPVRTMDVATHRTLAGKVSLITGSTSGIGLGIARAFAAAGASVVLNGFGKPEEISAVQKQL